MIEIRFGRKTCHFPTAWDELDRQQFVGIAQAMTRFETGETDFERFKMEAVISLLGLEFRKLQLTDALMENFFRISERLDFIYVLRGGNVLEFTVSLSSQILPFIGRHKGYRFQYLDGSIETDLTAERYVDALSLLQLYVSGRSQNILDRLVATLYCSTPYNAENVQLSDFSDISQAYKVAVYMNFRGVLEWIRKIPKYDIVFNRSRKEEKNHIMGMEGSLYALSKDGYGSFREVCELGLFTYLDMLLEQSMSAIRQLSAAGQKPSEIAGKLNLSVEQVMTVL